MEESPLLRAAAAVAKTFHIDPITVLNTNDPFVWCVRIAAHNYITEQERKAMERARAK